MKATGYSKKTNLLFSQKKRKKKERKMHRSVTCCSVWHEQQHLVICTEGKSSQFQGQ
jgi:hypothetical protein